MSVYVDNMYRSYGRMRMRHMLTDSDEELRWMADSIGVAQRWHQGDHFDICMVSRRKVVVMGTIEVTSRQMAAMRAYRRKFGYL